MSFQGYARNLCEDGHLTELDVMSDDIEECQCGKKIIWKDTIDQTNACNVTDKTEHDNGSCDCQYFKLEVKEPELRGQNRRLVKSATYKIPESGGTILKGKKWAQNKKKVSK